MKKFPHFWCEQNFWNFVPTRFTVSQDEDGKFFVIFPVSAFISFAIKFCEFHCHFTRLTFTSHTTMSELEKFQNFSHFLQHHWCLKSTTFTTHKILCCVSNKMFGIFYFHLRNIFRCCLLSRLRFASIHTAWKVCRREIKGRNSHSETLKFFSWSSDEVGYIKEAKLL